MTKPTLQEVVENSELRELIEILGLRFTPNNGEGLPRYGKVIVVLEDPQS
jgi:DNA gyrase/topoisomerase IV subunit B